MPQLSAGEAKSGREKCQCNVLDFDLSKQRCSPTLTSGRSGAKSSEACCFELLAFFFNEIMRSKGARGLFVSIIMILSLKNLLATEMVYAKY